MLKKENPFPPENWSRLPPVRFSWSNTELVGTITAISPEGLCTVTYDPTPGFAGGTTEVPLKRILNLNPTIESSSFGIPEQVQQRISSGSEGVKGNIEERMK